MAEDETKPSAEKAYRCKFCGEKFETPQKLANHVRNHHLARSRRGRPPNPLRCPECKQVFESPKFLGLHRRQRHGVFGKSKTAVAMRQARGSASVRRCPECGAGPFATPAALGSHRLIKHDIAGVSAGAKHRQERIPLPHGNSTGVTHEAPQIDELSFVIGNACATVRDHIALIAERDEVPESLLRARVIAFLEGASIRKSRRRHQ
jgi:hypothetical protein